MSDAMLSMVLDIEVERHKRELRERFAAARARLIPPPKEKSQQEIMLTALQQASIGWLQGAVANQAQGLNPYNYGGVQSGLGYGLFGGMFGDMFSAPPRSHSAWGF